MYHIVDQSFLLDMNIDLYLYHIEENKNHLDNMNMVDNLQENFHLNHNNFPRRKFYSKQNLFHFIQIPGTDHIVVQ